jgi:hypothetical protein
VIVAIAMVSTGFAALVQHQVFQEKLYMHSVYWAIAFATTFGADPAPTTNSQYLLTMTWMILAVTLWGAILQRMVTFLSATLFDG